MKSSSILPIVVDKTAPPEPTKDLSSSFFSSFWSIKSIPVDWIEYVHDTNTARNSEGEFVTTKNLRIFLSPYKSLINDVDQFSEIKLTIFFSFFLQLQNRSLRKELKELHLSKVVVLLQLLADPNLPSSTISFPKSFLWSTFDSGQSGLDILNLLFSYGLDYEKFKDNLSAFSRDIYQPISEILPDNEYTRVYNLLNSAYSYYKSSDYAEASECYHSASELLAQFAALQEGSNKTIQDDYLSRSYRSVQYRNICQTLLSKKNELTKIGDNSYLTPCNPFWRRKVHYSDDPEESSHNLLLKKNN